MSRMVSPYAIGSVVLLVLGLTVTRLAPMQGPVVTWGSTTYGFTWQMPMYGLAAFFCLFAFLTSIGYIPFSPAVSRWHFWLSAGSVLLILVCSAEITMRLSQAPLDTRVGPGVTLAVGLILVSLPVFCLAQIWFVWDFLRAMLRMHGAG